MKKNESKPEKNSEAVMRLFHPAEHGKHEYFNRNKYLAASSENDRAGLTALFFQPKSGS